MKKVFYAIITATFSLLAISASAGTGKITWSHPDKYSDIQASSSSSKLRFRKQIFRSLDKFVTQYTKKNLPENYQLNLTVTDLDLAGYVDFNNIERVRIVRDADIPRIKFHYQLKNGDKEISSGDVKLRDLDFLRKNNFKLRNTDFFYEKQLLKDWFKKSLLPLTKNA